MGDISERRVLLIGAGELAELTLKHLSQRGLKGVVCNKQNSGKSFELAKNLAARSFSWDKLKNEIAVADVVLSTIQGQFKITRSDFFRLRLPMRPK